MNAELPKKDDEKIKKLILDLKQGNNDERATAVEALEKIGPAVIPVLIEVLKDENEWVRSTVAYALGRIGPAALVIPALTEALKDKDEGVSRTTKDALSFFIIAKKIQAKT